MVNILTGDRDHLTKYLTEHQDVQSMWYFGSAAGSKFVEFESAENVKRTWVNYGIKRDWTDPEQGQGEEFLYHSIQCKNIWIPMGDIFANWIIMYCLCTYFSGIDILAISVEWRALIDEYANVFVNKEL